MSAPIMAKGSQFLPTVKTRARYRQAASGLTLQVGSLVQLDIAHVDAATQAGQGLSYLLGSGVGALIDLIEAGFENCVEVVTEAQIGAGMYGVVSNLLDGAGADDSLVELTLQGKVQVLTSANISARGTPIMKSVAAAAGTAANDTVRAGAVNPGTLDFNFARLGTALSTGNGSGTKTLIWAWFDGITPTGSNANA